MRRLDPRATSRVLTATMAAENMEGKSQDETGLHAIVFEGALLLPVIGCWRARFGMGASAEGVVGDCVWT